jgi:hypothetical protein
LNALNDLHVWTQKTMKCEILQSISCKYNQQLDSKIERRISVPFNKVIFLSLDTILI